MRDRYDYPILPAPADVLRAAWVLAERGESQHDSFCFFKQRLCMRRRCSFPTQSRKAKIARVPNETDGKRPGLVRYASRVLFEGTLTRRELASSTGLVFGEVLVELGKRSLPLPIVSPRRRPEQDALFERALRGGE